MGTREFEDKHKRSLCIYSSKHLLSLSKCKCSPRLTPIPHCHQNYNFNRKRGFFVCLIGSSPMTCWLGSSSIISIRKTEIALFQQDNLTDALRGQSGFHLLAINRWWSLLLHQLFTYLRWHSLLQMKIHRGISCCSETTELTQIQDALRKWRVWIALIINKTSPFQNCNCLPLFKRN